MQSEVDLQRFKQDKNSVLFATSSFWEGVDVQGDSLVCVILTRLPFKVPTNPIIEARTEYVHQLGGNPFLDYLLPQAVLKFRQGFGRLIRNKQDRGAVIIFDKRVLIKSYGEKFLKSLPACDQISGPYEKLAEKLESFFVSPS